MVDKVFKVCRYCLTTNCPFLISLDIKYCDYIFKILLLKWIALIHYHLIDALKKHAESVFSYISPLFKNIFSNSDFYLQYTERFFQLYICISKLWNIEKASNTFIITTRKTCLTFNALQSIYSFAHHLHVIFFSFTILIHLILHTSQTKSI